MWPKMVRGSPLLLLLLLALKVRAEAEPEAAPKPQPQDPQYNNEEYNYNYGDDYGDEYYGYGEEEEGQAEDYDAPSEPDEDSYGLPAENTEDTGNPEASRWDRGRDNDPCRGVVCPEIDCPQRPYIPQGECCPICPGRSQVAPVRPNLQVSKKEFEKSNFCPKIQF